MRTYASRLVQGYGGRGAEEDHVYLRENYTTLGRSRRTSVAPSKRGGASKARAQVPAHRLGINSLTPDYFKVIDTPMKAYILGRLTVDGFVTKAGQVCLALHEKDRALVEAVRDRLAPGARIGTYKTRTTPMVRFSVSAPGLVADLASHGVVNGKSLITVWPTGLPDEFVNGYICGYFDGDGSLGLKPWFRWTVVSGNPEFLRIMQAKILDLTGLMVGGPYQDRRHEHAWSIIATGEPVRAHDAWIHEDVPGLARKNLAAVLKSDKVA